MSRRNRIMLWLAAIIALLALGYASLPWLLAAVITQQLAAQGASDIQVRVDYPNWHGIRLHSIAFKTISDHQWLSCEIPEVAVTYRPAQLLTGRVARVHIPRVTLQIKSGPGGAPAEPGAAALPLAALLSGQWLADIPIGELSLPQLRAHWQSAADAVYTLQISAQLREANLQVNGDMQLPAPQKPLTFSLDASHTGVTRLFIASAGKSAQPMLTLLANPLAAERQTTEPGQLKLNGTLSARFDMLLPMLAAFSGMNELAGIEGELNSQWQAQITEADWRITGEAAVHGLGGRWREQPLPRSELTANFNADPQQVMLQTILHTAEQAVVLESTGVLQFASGYGNAELKLRPVAFSESAPVLQRLLGKWPYPFHITSGRVSGQGRLVWQKDFNLEGDLQLDKLGGRYEKLAFAELSGEVKARLGPQRLTLQSILHAADRAVVLETSGVHQLASGQGQADFKLQPVVFSDSGFVLSRLLKKWPYPFDINTGQIAGHGRLVWQQDLRLQADLRLDKLGGHYNKLLLAGLSGETAVALDTGKGGGLRTSKDVQLQLDVVDVGFPVQNIAARFALTAPAKTWTPVVQVKKFSAETLGGKMYAEPFTLDLGRDRNPLLVKLEQIGLNEIMQLEQQQGLAGSGMLDGQIPLEISSEGIVVTEGQLAARAPGGVIRYTPTAKVADLAQSNPSVGMVVKALSNFQYQVLKVSSDYKRGGDLVLQVRLEGKNPDWQAGQPIHLNLNLQENIPALLRSLQLSDDISERMRRYYENLP